MKWKKPVMSALGGVGPCHCPEPGTYDYTGCPSLMDLCSENYW